MSSPFNPLTALTPGLHATPGLGASPSVPLHPFLLPSASPAAASPGTLLALAGSYSAPLTNLNLAGTPAAQQQLSIPVPLPPPTAATATPQTEADDTLRAIPDIARLLERAEAVRLELSSLEGSVFTSGEGAERSGGLARLEALQLDYAQTLLALIQLGGTYLVGALPVPLSSAVPPAAPAAGAGAGAGPDAAPPASTTPAPTSGVGALPTPAQLATFAEGRAAAMFARREGVKTAAKAVQDVLKGAGK
ncbi:uncharacterized protein LOC62_02G002401 [Vanrija pseudolonga]|uniref:Uncharacterized protein n=1 Tax=Vanrija pseudolonga TaxID=143232 RepID=A0AAF0Y681_9TREE|nr:hypothetical protein LOC62_02G002401 [Vanrija pseudolonga]